MAISSHWTLQEFLAVKLSVRELGPTQFFIYGQRNILYFFWITIDFFY